MRVILGGWEGVNFSTNAFAIIIVFLTFLEMRVKVSLWGKNLLVGLKIQSSMLHILQFNFSVLKVNCNVFTSWFLMTEFGPQNTVSILFFKNLFSFSRYRPSKSGTSAGSILGLTRFPKIIIGKPSSVTSQVIKVPWSVQSAVTYVTAKQVETATFDDFWKKLWFTVLLMTA